MTDTTIPLADLVAQGWDVSGELPKMLTQGRFRAEKWQADGKAVCTVWRPFVVLDNEDDDVGLCFDFSPDELDDLLAILTALKNALVDVQEGD